VLGREVTLSLPDSLRGLRLPALFTISVPEPPPQLAAALHSSAPTSILAAALSALLAVYAACHLIAALARAIPGRRGGADLGRLRAEAGALDERRALAAALQEAEADVQRTLQVRTVDPASSGAARRARNRPLLGWPRCACAAR
jgi:hypothetical protein